MVDQIAVTEKLTLNIANQAISQLRQEYVNHQHLFQAQLPLVQRYLEVQAASLANAAVKDAPQVTFSLPDQVNYIDTAGDVRQLTVPGDKRNYSCGGFKVRVIHKELRDCLSRRFSELEHSSNPAISTGATLLRYAVAIYMVHNLLPAGKMVHYRAMEGEEIPSIPESQSAETSSADAEVDNDSFKEHWEEANSEKLTVPYVKAAQQFFLPQWVAFDEKGKLLVNGLNEAETQIASMQNYLEILHSGVGLASFMVADEDYQKKRYGMLGQLVNQGRALAKYEVEEIIRIIQKRVSAHTLDRGLSLSLPYFNDQTLHLEIYDLDVIPVGRVMFVPAFLVLAVRQHGAKIAQDTRLNQSTRKYLLTELSMLERAFVR